MSTRATLTATIITAACTLPTHATNETIFLTGDAAPGTTGTFDDFGQPVINKTGQVAFRADLLLGGTVVPANDRGIWRDNTLIAREGDTAPDTPPGVTFSSITSGAHPPLNDTGQTAYKGLLTGTGIDFTNDQGIWRNSTLIAQKGDPAPGTSPGVLFSVFSSGTVLNNVNQTAYNASLSGTGIDGTNDRGYWINDTLVVREGNPAPGLSPGVNFKDFNSLTLNPAGQAAFRANLTGTDVTIDNDNSIWRDATLIARQGDPAPGTPPGVLFGGSNFGKPDINAAGQVAYTARLTGTDIDDSNDQGIWRGNTLIARRGSQAPGTPAGTNFYFLADPLINAPGQVTYLASLTGPGVSTANDTGLWRDDQLISREGDPAPDTAPGIKFGDVLEFATNTNGTIALHTYVQGPGITPSTERGIWLTDGIDNIKVIRSGDTLEGKTVAVLFINDDSAGQNGKQISLNDRSQLAYTVRFTDDTEGVFRYTPELQWRSNTPAANWDDTANWTLSTPPASPHHVTIAPDTDINITTPANNTSLQSLTIGGGLGNATVAFDGASLFTQQPLNINRNGHLRIEHDSLDADDINLGDTPAAPTDNPATLTILGAAADLNNHTTNLAINAPAILNATNGTYIFTDTLILGVSDQGTLNVLSGADGEADNTATIAQDPGSTGTLNIDGHGSTFLSTPVIDAGVGGNAHINVTNGGTLSADDGINLAIDATSVSTINVQGPTSTINAGLLFAGDNGHATITAQDGATLAPGLIRLGISATGNGTLTVTGPGTTLNASGLEIALNGTGSVTLADGATATSNDVVLGQSPTANASLTLSGPGTTWNAGITLIGLSGSTANFRVEDGATFTAVFLTTTIGSGAGSTATATVTGPGSTFSATGPLTIGTSGGTGTLNLTDGGLASFSGLTTIDPGGTVNINGGTLTTQGLAGTGDLHLNTGTLNLTNNTMIDAKLFDPNLTLSPDTAINITNDATIDNLINATIDGGTLTATTLTNDGTLVVVSGLVDADNKFINNATVLLGNPATARISTPSFENLGELSGTGRITGDLSNEGTVDAETGTIRIQKNAFNNPSGIISLTGGQFRVNQAFTNATNALVIGNGTLRADGGITNQSKANMAFSGPTNILGDVNNQPAATIVSSGPGPLTFFDDVTNDGEIRTNTNGFTVFLGTTSGSGAYTGTGTVVYEADFTPGSSPGINSFDGNLTFGPFASLEIEAQATVTAPVAGTDHDQLTVANTLTLDGTLNVVALPDAGPIQDTPLGNNYIAITYGTRTPNSFFHTINGTFINTAFALAPILDDTAKTFTLRATIPGDLNLDNKVSVADLAEFALNFDTTPGLHNETDNQSSWLYGDFNTDGAITVADLSLLALNFGFDATDPAAPIGLSLQQAATLAGIDLPKTAIPEPATAILLLTSALAIPAQRRRSHTTKQT